MGTGAVSHSFVGFGDFIPYAGLPCLALMHGRCLVLLRLDMPWFADTHWTPALS